LISTVTTSTVTTIVALSSVLGLREALSLVAVLAFLALLITREIVGSSNSRNGALIVRGLNIGIIPLGVAFVLIAGATLLTNFRF
jgi:hypothetical protein